MARLIDTKSVRQAESGFQNVAIGKVTHSKLRQLANERGVTMASLVRELIERESAGKQGELIERKANIGDVKRDTEQIVTMMSSLTGRPRRRPELDEAEEWLDDEINAMVGALARRIAGLVKRERSPQGVFNEA